MAAATKQYIKGSIKELKFDNGSKLVASLLLEDLAKAANEKGYVSIAISERKEADQYGNTHYAYVNDYKPKEKGGAAPKRDMTAAKTELKKPKFKQEASAEDDLPF